MWVVGPCASFASPAPGRTWIDRDAHARSTPRWPPRRCARRAAHARSARKARHASSGRACCCGGGFLLLRFPEAGVPRAAARDPRGARAVCDVRARVERRRELRVGGVVRLLRLARRACCCRLVLFAFSTRPDGGKTTIRLPTADETPTHGRRNAYPGRRRGPWATSRSPSHPKGPGAEIAPIASQYRPICTPSLRAILSRRPLAPPA
jgi:hypothetical protein